MNPPVPDDQLPALNQFSDVAFLYWKDRIRDVRLKRIRYLLSVYIRNGDTTTVINQALASIAAPLSPWPGHSFFPDSDHYKAILGMYYQCKGVEGANDHPGTPNGQGFGYFIAEHKDRVELNSGAKDGQGSLYISEIVVFYCNDREKSFCLLFKVLPVPPPKNLPPVEVVKRTVGADLATETKAGNYSRRLRDLPINSSRPVAVNSPWSLATNLSLAGDPDRPPQQNPPPRQAPPLAAAADEKYWCDCTSKGSTLLKAMRSSDHAAGQLLQPKRESAASSWNNMMDLKAWGYTYYTDLSDNLIDFDAGHDYPRFGWGVGDALRALHLNDKADANNGLNFVYEVIHGRRHLDDSGVVPYDHQRYLAQGRPHRVSRAFPDYAWAVDVSNIACRSPVHVLYSQ